MAEYFFNKWQDTYFYNLRRENVLKAKKWDMHTSGMENVHISYQKFNKIQKVFSNTQKLTKISGIHQGIFNPCTYMKKVVSLQRCRRMARWTRCWWGSLRLRRWWRSGPSATTGPSSRGRPLQIRRCRECNRKPDWTKEILFLFDWKLN